MVALGACWRVKPEMEQLDFSFAKQACICCNGAFRVLIVSASCIGTLFHSSIGSLHALKTDFGLGRSEHFLVACVDILTL